MTEPGLPSVAATVLTFLESVGRRSEAELYLDLFRRLPKESFALVAPQTSVLREGPGVLSEQLGYLKRLGLFAPIVLGAFDREATGADRDALVDHLGQVGVLAETLSGTLPPESLVEQVRDALRVGRSPVVLFDGSVRDVLVELARGLSSRKIVVLRGRGGIGPHGLSRIELSPGHVLEGHTSGIGVINLRSDLSALSAGGHLAEDEVELLTGIGELLDRVAEGRDRSPVLNVASPLSLLEELFTVRGAGTLIKRGASIDKFADYGELDSGRLESLLRTSFDRALRPGFFDRPPLRIYLERDYRGVALLEPGVSGAFLSKFAVQPVARGEGLGQDLWWSLVRDNPAVYWRSRPDNPVNPWYATVCGGMQRGERWNVYWRGIPAETLASVIFDASQRPEDFDPPGSARLDLEE